MSKRKSVLTESTISGLPITREAWTHWREYDKGPQRQLRDWSISPVKKHWNIWDYSAWRREGLGGGNSSVYINICKEDVKTAEPGSSQWCPVTGQETLGTN